jgi:predicted glycosyltransferase
VRIWFDMTASAHPLVLRPVIERLQAAGHEVTVTARDFGQTLGILERLGIPYTRVGEHAGASRLKKGQALFARTAALRKLAKRAKFDLAVGHGSNDLALAAWSLRIPAVNTFDYEFAVTQHRIGCRLAKRVMVPDAIPLDRLRRFGVDEAKHFPYPGLKEEYYLADFEPDAAVLDELGVDRERILVVLRPPPEVSMYHAENPVFPRVLESLGRREDVHAVLIPRVPEQGERVRAMALPSVIVPEQAVDAQSLIALADLVVSAGGTMNREAVALGTPVYTTFAGTLGGVDERLIADGRLRPLTDPAAMEVARHRGEARERVRRDPAVMTEIVLGAAR